MKFNTQQIKDLHENGKTYKEISDIIGCSIWTIHYKLNPKRKKSQVDYFKNKKRTDPLFIKRKQFLTFGVRVVFTLKELKQKLDNNPKCYLTGESINLKNSSEYSLDHKIPLSRGGESSLENLGIIKSEINQAKYNLTPDEFINLCHRVLNHHTS